MLSNNKFLGKCWYEGRPWIRLAMESESYGGKRNKLYFLFGTAYYISSMESVGMLQVVFVGGMDTPPKMFLSLFFALSFGTSTNPYFPLRWAFLLLYAIFIFEIESPSSIIKSPTRGQYDRT